MSAPESEAYKDLTPEEFKRSWDGQSIDWFLQDLVDLVNVSDGGELPITLMMEGLTVSGVLISGRNYFDLFAEAFVSGWDEGDAKERVFKYYKETGERVYTQDNGSLPLFLHLKEARVHEPGGMLPNDVGVLWRGRINAVSGFCLGRLMSGEGD